MIKKIFVLLILLTPKFVHAQKYEKEYETLFAWEIKQIDEFIDRFNNDDQTLIQEYNQKHSGAKLTRDQLIKSLFNAARKDWNFLEITSFINQVNDKTNPQYLNFEGGNWFASVSCSTTWNGKPETVVFKLVVQQLPSGGYKWVIADAKFPLQKSVGVKTEQPILPIPPNSKASLNPMSHTTDFMNIDMVSKNPKNLSDYIITGNDYSNDLCIFVDECLNNQLKIISANTITYTFLQIPGWQLEIKQYNRSTKNSGWLVSKLTKLPAKS